MSMQKIGRKINNTSVWQRILEADACHLNNVIDKKSIDLVVTSPPYWRCRDYGHPSQIGHEKTPEKYIEIIFKAVNSWKSLLRPHASVIINIGDIFRNGRLVGIPALFEVAAHKNGWLVTNRAIWAKNNGVPVPRGYRLASRYEFIFQLALHKGFYFDIYALQQHLGQASNPGDIWHIDHTPSSSDHLAPFPPELARRAILLSCPERLCPKCGKPYTRRLEPTMKLNKDRPQSRRALEIYRKSKLTEEHIAAIRAVGISDAGKGRIIQNGSSKNSARTIRLAEEAKKVLGGYFREFTFAPKKQTGWNRCGCKSQPAPGTVLDPFLGSATTLRVAAELRRNAIGSDLILPPELPLGKDILLCRN